MAFEIDLLPVGSKKKSGDCIAFRYGDLEAGKKQQTVVVVDGGYASTWADSLKPHLQKYYNCEYDGKIHVDLVILSHTDMDHVSGLVEMAKDEDVEIGRIMMHEPWYELTPTWFKDGRITKQSLKERIGDAFEKALQLSDLTQKADKLSLTPCRHEINSAFFYILGPSAKFYKECIANCDKTPEKDEKVKDLPQAQSSISGLEFEKYEEGHITWDDSENTSPINESSLIVLFEYENVKVLLTGDAGKEGLRQAIAIADKNGIKLNDCTIIKMPHHGSRKNVNPEIMANFIGSKKLYYSCASDDLGHHPSQRLINMLNEKGFRQLSTSGSTLHWGVDAPERGWPKASAIESFEEIEK